MVDVIGTGEYSPAPPGPDRAPPATRRENLATVAFAAWLIGGLFVDGWAHNTGKPESFFTPWHGLFYSGFLAVAVWMATVVRRRGDGHGLRSAAPAGYGLGVVGVGIFAAGGVADMAWHQVFGIEVNLEALVSPSHLLLFAGALLVITSPLRAAWADLASPSGTLREFAPVLGSTLLTTGTVAFLLMPFSPWLTGAMTRRPLRFIERRVADPEVASWLRFEVELEGYAGILVTTLLLLGPTLFLLRRWRLPFGTLTLLYGGVATLMAAIGTFLLGPAFLSGALGGLAADLLCRRYPPDPAHPGRYRLVGAVPPLVLWLGYFGLLAAFESVGWSVELWFGSSVVSAFAGLGLSLLVVPPPLPAPAQE